MTRRLARVMLAVVVIFALGGCAASAIAGSGTVGAARDAHPSSAGHPSGGPDLSRNVLTLADLPAGWQVDHDNDDSDDLSGSGCGSGLDNLPDPAADREAFFKYGAAVPIFGEDVGYYPAHASQTYRRAVRALDKCRHLPLDAHTRLPIHRIRFAKIRDGAAAYAGSIEKQGIRFTFDLVVLRSGRYLLLAFYGALGTSTQAALRVLVEKAAGKLPS